ncbi:transmembrane protein 94-like [Chanos chanos]|uniref:Transmembrane protein 94-like n=1 Tax=Chanos chanos TaxID=29144 RepID=A0A6J2VUK4_CHACN|nr:transmembrane protein 94-like [Chanos chanos]
MATLQKLKGAEMLRRVETLLDSIQEVLHRPPSEWMKGTEDLFAPPSQAVSLQWTYRDSQLVNLPVSLLVEGDIISLRPGNKAPTGLRGVQDEEHVVLSRGDVFSHLSSPPSPFDSDKPHPHRLLQPQLFRVTRSPAVEVVQRCLEFSQNRPVSVLDNERFTVQSLLERGPAPLVLPRPLPTLEMLSLSAGRSHLDDTQVQFDDMRWRRHASSLRPLGLALQLALRDPGVVTRILSLSDHLTHAALLRTCPPCQPVSPPWGLCQLPKLLGSLQLISYGSADVILGACTEFWDGEELHTLTDPDRKKVLDFYQRSCMAGQCVAISYKPCQQAYDPDLDGTCYQARPDMVRLISGLDSACIRFVYFSKEEEVRSKVFAEKMGLETGWNCHVSLQSDRFPLDPENMDEPSRDTEEVCLLGEGVRERAASRVMEQEGASLIEDLNRAKLPKGIENVRPHLENIDNVPLLVPLFTDCTSQTECEMVCIMQEYGEVVCCLGSSQNINNNAIFLQSDISIALEPLVPTCSWSSADSAQRLSHSITEPMPLIQLSSAICGMACTIQLKQQDNNIIIKLIKQARHVTAGIRKCFLFLLQCQLSLVLIQILACLCQLPPPLGTSDVLFLSCFYFPLLSMSLLGKPSDCSIMKVPTGKNLRFLPKKTLRFFVLCFLLKFGLTVCTYLTCFGFILHGFCLQINHKDKELCHPAALLMPILNISIVLGSRLLWHDPARHHTFYISDISVATWLLGILWLLPLVFINEGIKLHEISWLFPSPSLKYLPIAYLSGA